MASVCSFGFFRLHAPNRIDSTARLPNTTLTTPPAPPTQGSAKNGVRLSRDRSFVKLVGPKTRNRTKRKNQRFLCFRTMANHHRSTNNTTDDATTPSLLQPPNPPRRPPQLIMDVGSRIFSEAPPPASLKLLPSSRRRWYARANYAPLWTRVYMISMQCAFNTEHSTRKSKMSFLNARVHSYGTCDGFRKRFVLHAASNLTRALGILLNLQTQIGCRCLRLSLAAPILTFQPLDHGRYNFLAFFYPLTAIAQGIVEILVT